MVGSRWLVVVAAVFGFLCVGIGAMGAHSLPKQLEKAGFSADVVAKKINQCEIGVRYHMYHTLAILALGLAPSTAQRRAWRIAAGILIVGIGLFSGGLYSMVYFDFMGHWSIVPLGGVVLMVGWLTLAISTVFPTKSPAGTGVSGG